jgi:DNA-binding HxlR family transcriptional regulator
VAVRRAADLLERRWTLQVLYASSSGATRFNEFLEALVRIPPTTLSSRLSELEQAGVLARVVVDSRPPHVEYRLTERGLALEQLVRALSRWAVAR